MKTFNLFATLLMSFVVCAFGQATGSGPVSPSTPPSPTPYTVVSRTANSAIWQRTTYEQAPDGRMIPHVHRYTELASGLNYPSHGKWVPSREQIESYPGGAVARQGQYQVIFANNLNSAGSIDMQTPDGKRLRSNILGLMYHDTASGQAVLIAEIQNSKGELISSNQVLYPNAFKGVKADVRYTYKKGSFEQDVILRGQPPSPQSFGMNPDTTELEVMTEFLNPPPATVSASPRQINGEPNQNISWGATRLGWGRAFDLGQTNSLQSQVPVIRQYMTVRGRTVLLEKVPFRAIQSSLQKLPLQASVNFKRPTVAFGMPVLPPTPLPQARPEPIKLAATTPPDQGYVLDYVALPSTLNGYTFQCDTTYYISGYTEFDGPGSVIIEGGTVIKFAHGAMLDLMTALYCNTAPYRPAVLTAKDDNTVGETISGSTGSPSGTYANYAIAMDGGANQTPIQNLRVMYAQWGVSPFAWPDSDIVRDCQFINDTVAIAPVDRAVVENVLFDNVDTAIQSWNNHPVDAAFVTAHNVNTLTTNNTLNITNSLFICVTNFGVSVSGAYNGTNRSDVGVFQTVGGGSYYLATNSVYRDAGTTNVDPVALADIQTKTTYPPIAYTNVTFTTAQTFSPQAQRDTNTPDLGYHYDPLDYDFGGCIANSNLTFTAGTAAAWFRTTSGYGHLQGQGIYVENYTTTGFQGTEEAPDYWVRADTVQENNTSPGYGGGGIIGGDYLQYTNSLVPAPVVDLSFTRCSMLGGEGGDQFRDGYYAEFVFRARNCEFYYSGVGAYGSSCYFTNCLGYRFTCGQVQGSSGNEFVLQNCTWIGGQVQFEPTLAIPLVVHDCAFDGTIFYIANYGGGANADYDYNAYTNGAPQLTNSGPHDVIVTNFNWQTSWFGNYYLPADSPLIDAGDVTADTVGLYHFTTQTNQTIEADSQVDIGYHYVASDAYGNPLDTLWWGIPDYLADSNGALGNWLMKYFGHLGVDPYADYDCDGTNNLQDYLDGIDPNKISFTVSFPNQYVSTNIVIGNVTVFCGNPSYYAVLVDGTNFSQATWNAYTSSNITINLGSTQGTHDLWIGLRGLPPDAYQTWEETTLVLDSVPPAISITSPTDGASLNSTRVDVSGNFTAGSLEQIIVNGVPAFVSGTNYEALNVPLNPGSNTVTAVVEDFTGLTNVASITVIGLTNADGGMNDPVDLQGTPIAGFVPLQLAFQIISNNVPGTIQEVRYDFTGDNNTDFVTNNLDSITYTYASNGEYFPVVTIQTTVGTFSSSGGWNSSDPNRLQITVQSPPTQTTLANVTDPVALKWNGTDLYVLSGSSGTVTEFATNGTSVGPQLNVGVACSGFDVDAAGNIYVALTASNQVWKFILTNNTYAADTNFGSGGFIGNADGSAGSGSNQFNGPFDVLLSPDGGGISVSDSGNDRIQQFDSNGDFQNSFGSSGSEIGQFNTPKGLAYDSAGTMYIVDSGNNRIVLVQVNSVVGATGINGTALGQFAGPINISIGERGVYVADTGNNRIQSFNLPAPNGLFSIDSSSVRFAVSANLNQPAAVVAVDGLTNDMFYVADTGNNRVILYAMPNDDLDTIQAVWNNMTTNVAAGDISGALTCFSVASVDDYRRAFLSVGTANTISAINQTGPLTPVYVNDNRSEYYFTNTIDRQVITFPVTFDKENGVWKILDF